jgi:hypothetical protein
LFDARRSIDEGLILLAAIAALVCDKSALHRRSRYRIFRMKTMWLL